MHDAIAFFVMPTHTGTEALAFMLRWVHLIAGITWVGLLYFFNLVNVPFMKQVDAATKPKIFQYLTMPVAAIVPLERDADRVRGLLVLVASLCCRGRAPHGGEPRQHHRTVSPDLGSSVHDSLFCDLKDA